jgi:hypothetical protein
MPSDKSLALQYFDKLSLAKTGKTVDEQVLSLKRTIAENEEISRYHDFKYRQSEQPDTSLNGLSDILEKSYLIDNKDALLSIEGNKDLALLKPSFSQVMSDDLFSVSAKGTEINLDKISLDSNTKQSFASVANVLNKKLNQGDLKALEEVNGYFQKAFNSGMLSKEAKNKLSEEYTDIANFFKNKKGYGLAKNKFNILLESTNDQQKNDFLKSITQNNVNQNNAKFIYNIGLNSEQEKDELVKTMLDANSYIPGSFVYNKENLNAVKSISLGTSPIFSSQAFYRLANTTPLTTLIGSSIAVQSQKEYLKELANIDHDYVNLMGIAVKNKQSELKNQLSKVDEDLKENVNDQNLLNQKNKLQKDLLFTQEVSKKLDPLENKKNFYKNFYPALYQEEVKKEKSEIAYNDLAMSSWYEHPLRKAKSIAYRSTEQIRANTANQLSGISALFGGYSASLGLNLASKGIAPPSYRRVDDLNKNSLVEPNEVIKDRNGDPIYVSNVVWTDEKGKSHWNLSAATEQTLPIAVDIAETILLSRGAGLLARGAGVTWANMGRAAKLSTEAQKTFLTQVAPRISTFGNVYATTFPRFYAEERNNFKNENDAIKVSTARATIEALTETVVPDTEFFKGGRSFGALDGVFKKLGKYDPTDFSKFTMKRDVLLGLLPDNSMSALKASMLVAPSAIRKTLSGALQETLEEELSLLGNYFVDKYAGSKDFTVEQTNELTYDNALETFISGFVPSLFISGIPASLNAKSRRDQARWDIANNSDQYVAFINKQVQDGKITKDDAIKKTAVINRLKDNLSSMEDISQIKDLSNLLDDKELQFQYFNARLYQEDLLSVDTSTFTEEQLAQYQKQLDDSSNVIIDARKRVEKYNNLTEDDKKKIITGVFEKQSKKATDPNQSLATLLNTLYSTAGATSQVAKDDTRKDLIDELYNKFILDVETTIDDRLAGFQTLLEESPEKLTTLELQIAKDQFIPFLQQYKGSKRRDVTQTPFTVREQGPQPKQFFEEDLIDLIKTELSTRSVPTEEEYIEQAKVNFKNPETKDFQNTQMIASELSEAELKSGQLSENAHSHLTDGQRLILGDLLEKHKAQKEEAPSTKSSLEKIIENAEPYYRGIIKGLSPEEALAKKKEVNKSIVDSVFGNVQEQEKQIEKELKDQSEGKKAEEKKEEVKPKENQIEKIKKSIINKLKKFLSPTYNPSSTVSELRGMLSDIVKNLPNILENQSDVIELINTLSVIIQNQYVDNSFISKQEQLALNSILNRLEIKGYEVAEMLGNEYVEGMNVTANFIPSNNENSKTGKKIITRVIKPQVNFNGKMIQSAQIEVTLDYDDEYDGKSKSSKEEPSKYERGFTPESSKEEKEEVEQTRKVDQDIFNQFRETRLEANNSIEDAVAGEETEEDKKIERAKQNNQLFSSFSEYTIDPENYGNNLSNLESAMLGFFLEDGKQKKIIKFFDTVEKNNPDFSLLKGIVSEDYMEEFSLAVNAMLSNSTVEEQVESEKEEEQGENITEDEKSESEIQENNVNEKDTSDINDKENEKETQPEVGNFVELNIVELKKDDTPVEDSTVTRNLNIVQILDNELRKNSNLQVYSLIQTPLNTFKKILSPERYNLLQQLVNKKSLTEQQKGELKNILTYNRMSILDEGMLNYILNNPSFLTLPNTSLSVVVDQDNNPIYFTSDGQIGTAETGVPLVTSIKKTGVGSSIGNNISTGPVRAKMTGTSSTSKALPLGSVKSSSSIIYVHLDATTSRVSPFGNTYTLETGGVYLQNNEAVYPYNRIDLTQIEGKNLYSLVQAFNEGTLPEGFPTDATEFLTLIGNNFYSDRKTENLRFFPQGKFYVAKLRDKNQLSIKSQNDEGKAVTVGKGTQEKLVEGVKVRKAFWANLLKTNTSFDAIIFDKEGKPSIKNFNSYSDYILSPEFGATVTKEWQKTLRFEAPLSIPSTTTEIQSSVAAVEENTVDELSKSAPVSTDAKADIERRRQEEYAKIDAKYSEKIKALEKRKKEDIERTGLAGDTRALEAFRAMSDNAKAEVDVLLNKELDELDSFEDKKEDIKNALEYILTSEYKGKPDRKRQSNEIGEKIAEKIATDLSNKGLIKQDGKYFSNLKDENLGVAWSVGKYFPKEFTKGFNAELSALEKPTQTTQPKEAPKKKRRSALERLNSQIANEKDPEGPDFKGLKRARTLSNKITKEQNEAAKAWVNNHPIFKNTSFIFDETVKNPAAYAVWSKAGIQLFQGANYAEAYHEAWHEFSQLYLTSEQKEKLYAEAKKIWGDIPFVELEEKIAESFRTYALTGGQTLPKEISKYKETKSIFQSIWDFLTNLFSEKKTIDKYFGQLYKGNISQYTRKESNQYFKELFSSKLVVTDLEGNTRPLSFVESQKVIDEVDGLFVTVANEVLKPHNASVINVLLNPEYVKTVYAQVVKYYKNVYQEEYEILLENDENGIEDLQQEQLLDYIGETIQNLPNILQYHKNNSSLFDNKVKKSNIENTLNDILENSENEGIGSFEQSIEENSQQDLASDVIINAIRTLPRYQNGEVVTHPTLGFSLLGDFNENWTILQRTLSGSNTYEDMYSKLKELSKKFPQFKTLLTYLKAPNESITRITDLSFKSQFFNLFTMPYMDGSTVKITRNDKGEITETRVLKALSLDVVQLRSQLDNDFNFESGQFKTLSNNGSYSLDTDTFFTTFPEVPSIPAADPQALRNWYDQIFLQLDALGISYSSLGIEALRQEKPETLARNLNLIRTKLASLLNKNEPIFTPLTAISKEHVLENIKKVSSSVEIELTSFIYKDKGVDTLVKLNNVNQKWYNLKTNKELTEKEVVDAYNSLVTNKVKSENTAVAYFLGIEIEANPSYANDMRYNAVGKQIWSVNQHTYMTKIVSVLNDANLYPTLDDVVKQFPYLNYSSNTNARGSWVLQYLFNTAGKRITENGQLRKIDIVNLLGIEDGFDGEKTIDTINSVKHFADVTGLLNGGVEEINRLSGKSTTRGIGLDLSARQYLGLANTENNALSFVKDDKAYLPYKEVFGRFILPILKSEIDTFNNKVNNQVFKVKMGETPSLAYFQDILPESLRLQLVEDLKDVSLDKLSETFLALPYAKDVYAAFNEYIDTSAKLSQDILEGYPLTFEQLAKYHTYSFIMRVEQHKLFFNHPFYYKSEKDIEKRLSAWNAYGSYSLLDDANINALYNLSNSVNAQEKAYQEYALENNIPIIARTKDPRKISYLVFNDTVVFSETAKSSKAYDSVRDAYVGSKDSKAQDAASVATLDFFRKFYATSTGITVEMEQEFERQNKIWSTYLKLKSASSFETPLLQRELDNLLNEKPAHKFNIKKLQYAGNNPSVFGPTIPIFHKYSVKPLLPSEAVLNSRVADIMEKLYASGADYGVFTSGTKISETISAVDLFDNNGKVDKSAQVTGNIDFNYLKEQVIVENKESFLTIFSSQLRKLIYKDINNVNEQELYDAYALYMKNLVEYDSELFLEKLDNKEKLVEFILGELSRKGAAQATKDLIQLKEDGKLKYLLDSLIDRTVMESAIVSSVKNKVIRQKVNGAQRVQFPVSLMSDRKLKYYDLKNGKITKAETMISFSKLYYPLLNLEYEGRPIGELNSKGEPIDPHSALKRLNEALNDSEFKAKHQRQITISAIRIPGQGYNSMENFEIVEFLPEESGDIILVPDEMVVKSGSDFDIDKLFCYDPYIEKDGSTETNNLTPKEAIARKKQLTADYDNKRAELQDYIEEKTKVLAELDEFLKSKNISSVSEVYKELKALKAEVADNDAEFNEEVDLNQMLLDKFKNGLSREEVLNKNLKGREKVKFDERKNKIKQLSSILSDYSTSKLGFYLSEANQAINETRTELEEIKNELKSIRGRMSNSILFNISDRLTQEEIFEDLITPNSTSEIDKAADPLVKSKSKWATASYTNIVNPIYQLYVFSLNSYKKSLGTDAKNNVLHSILQKAKIHIVDEKSNLRYVLPANRTKDGKLTFEKDRDTSGQKISLVQGQMISAHVDIEKDDRIALLNFNNVVTPIVNYMTMLGTPFKNIVDLINNRPSANKESAIAKFSKNPDFDSMYNYFSKYDDTQVKKILKLSLTDKGTFSKKKFISASIGYLVNNTNQESIDAILNEQSEYGDLIRFSLFMELKDQADKVRILSANTDFDTFSPQNFESLRRTGSELVALKKDKFFDEEGFEKVLNESIVSPFQVQSTILDKFEEIFPVSANKTVTDGIVISFGQLSKKNRFLNYESFSRTFKNDFLFSMYVNEVPNVISYETLLDKTNPNNLKAQYESLKKRFAEKNIDSNNRIFNLVRFNTDEKSKYFRTGLRQNTFDYSVDYYREEFENGLNYSHPDLDPVTDAQLIDDFKSFMEGFAYAGILGSQLNKRFDSYLSIIPEQIYTYPMNSVLENFQALSQEEQKAKLSTFYKRFLSNHPEFVRQKDVNPDLRYYKDYVLSRESITPTTPTGKSITAVDDLPNEDEGNVNDVVETSTETTQSIAEPTLPLESFDSEVNQAAQDSFMALRNRNKNLKDNC